jgi:hypothetical protein
MPLDGQMNFIRPQSRMNRNRVERPRSVESGSPALQTFLTPLPLNVARSAYSFGAAQRNKETI